MVKEKYLHEKGLMMEDIKITKHTVDRIFEFINIAIFASDKFVKKLESGRNGNKEGYFDFRDLRLQSVRLKKILMDEVKKSKGVKKW